MTRQPKRSPVPPQPALHSPRAARAGAIRLALAVFLAALAWRAIYLLAITGTACLDINLDPISDMEAFHRWALTIVSGDWLGRANFHPWHPWQEAVAPRAQWDAWYGQVFHQEPFYPYLIAVMYLLLPREPISVILVQGLLGAAGCAATALLARRLAGSGPGWIAGILSIGYGPYLYYESLLLRDAILIPLHAVMLWAVVEARARSQGAAAWRWWGGAGVLAGLSFITKASILPFVMILAVLALRGSGGRRPWRAWDHAGALLAGFVLMALPVAARNVAVGAPPLQTTTRGPIELINGNNPWHPGIGWFDGDDARVSAYARDVLARAEGRLLPTAAIVIGGWKGQPLDFVRLQVRKAGYFAAPFEMPNNASYSWFRLNSFQLRHLGLSFFWVSPLAALGLLVSWSRRGVMLPLQVFLATGFLTTITFYVIARFRAPLMPAILVLAAVGIWWIVERAARRAIRPLAAGLVLVGALLAANAATTYPDEDLVRPQDHIIAMQGYRARGDLPRALEEAMAGRARFPAFPQFWREAGMLQLELGRPREALASLREALARDPGDEASRRTAERLQRELAAGILPPR